MARLPRRKHIPESVKVKALLIKLGFDPDRPIDWNHTPPLGLRELDEDTGLYTPDELDPRHLEPLYAEDHDRVTFGSKATAAGGDIHKIAKAKRVARDHEEHCRRMLSKVGIEVGQAIQKRATRKIQSRGFDKRHRPMRQKHQEASR